MKKNTLIALFSLVTTGVAGLHAQDWQLLDNFSDDGLGADWVVNGTLEVSTAGGTLQAGITGNSTSTMALAFPEVYGSGKFTVAFDFYLPTGPADLQNQAGFGVNSASQVTGTGVGGWGPIGADNRFQTANPAPQNLTKVPNWGDDALGTTEQGVWYNLWLVYDLDADPKTVTLYSKKATEAFDATAVAGSAYTVAVGPRPGNDSTADDFSAVEYFGFGVGLLDTTPDGYSAEDSLGFHADNLYVASGEKLEAKPESIAVEWTEVDTFDNGAPDADWQGDLAALNLDFSDWSAQVSSDAGQSRVNIYAPLPEPIEAGITTLTFDVRFPSGGTNWANFGVGGEDQVMQGGIARMGGNDRYVTFGSSDPQTLVKYTDWTNSLLPGDLQDTWYHVWVVYDISAGQMEFYAAPFGETIPAEPAGTYDLETDYADISYFVMGMETGGNEGLEVDNIYQSPARLLSFSPTAGEVGSGTVDQPSSIATTARSLEDEGWYYSEWLGYIWTNSLDDNYLFLPTAGWMHGGVIDAETAWLHNEQLGFVITGSGYWPGLYSMDTENWMFYIDGSNPATLYDFETGDEIQIEF